MNKKIWATLFVALLVLCPVAMACLGNACDPAGSGDEPVYDPGDGDDGTTPDGVGGNDPEHPQ